MGALPFPPFHFPSSPPLPFPSSSLAQPLPCQLGGLGSAVSSPSGVWSGVPVDIELGAF